MKMTFEVRDNDNKSWLVDLDVDPVVHESFLTELKMQTAAYVQGVAEASYRPEAMAQFSRELQLCADTCPDALVREEYLKVLDSWTSLMLETTMWMLNNTIQKLVQKQK